MNQRHNQVAGRLPVSINGQLVVVVRVLVPDVSDDSGPDRIFRRRTRTDST
ncbi:MAG: hypothetical protein JWM11_7245 [Planctomycetaceae bacterium]|nr:hypothetical protein [Planctomycetaceae bacterium]